MKTKPKPSTDRSRRGEASRSSFAPFLPSRIRIRWRRLLVRSAAGIALGAAVLGCAHQLAARSGPKTLPNLPVATAGGQQLWADVAWDGGWRVQTHVWTEHARLLDPGDVRRAWGSKEACLTSLEGRRERGEAGEPRERAVVLLHGLWRTRGAMTKLSAAFDEAGDDVIDIAYPSTRRKVAEHSAQVAELLNVLPGEGVELSFVTHSLGSLVVRDLLAREGDAWRERQQLGRAVFIAAPSGGAALANFGSRIPGALALYGKPSREIAAGLADALPAPQIPFALIAACRGTEDGWNPLIPGDDDGVVGVAETQLPGAADSMAVRGMHSFVMQDDEVVEATLRFVEQGRLRPAGER